MPVDKAGWHGDRVPTRNWWAIVPIKAPERRKTRLEGIAPKERIALTERMLGHVLHVLEDHPGITCRILLADAPRQGLGWIADRGRGLNAELEAARAILERDLLILHADLPQLTADDVSALLAAADHHGAAIAPDRHGTGTNALALKASANFAFRFGPRSYRLHAAGLTQDAVIVRAGLGLDIDTPSDLALASLSLAKLPLASRYQE